MALPAWAARLVDLYESGAYNQFLIYGNIQDRLTIPGSPPRLSSLTEFLMAVLLPRFDVVLSYDLGNGIRIEKGGDIFSSWPALKERQLAKQPLAAVESLTQYFRYCGNLARLQRQTVQVACLVKNTELIAPAAGGANDHELGAVLTLIRDWSMDNLLTGHPLATFLLSENLSDIHPLLARNPRAQQIPIPLPAPEEMASALETIAPSYRIALGENAAGRSEFAGAMAGATVNAAESLLKQLEHARKTPSSADLAEVKKQIIQAESQGLVEFVQSRATLDAIQGHDAVKSWLREDITLWKSGDVNALPKGYLLSGPVGTGKSFLVQCLAGEAAVPMVKLKNFRDRWVGSTESNLERIFRMLRALGRCYVFIDEADQMLGKRESGGDSGVSGRVYSMIAEEMSDPANRGRILWVLASSRPDLIEVDLKRPGRIDVKIPLFPTADAKESFELLRFLSKLRGLELTAADFPKLEKLLPDWLTPGAAEALAVKAYRAKQTQKKSAVDALLCCLEGYQPPVAREILAFQMQLAIAETSDPSFVPATFKTLGGGTQ
jgi:hypothetical protein